MGKRTKAEARLEVFNKTDGFCGYCGEKLFTNTFQVDHIIPKSQFRHYVLNRKEWTPAFLEHLTHNDVNHIDNLMPTCRVCNNWKGAHHLEFFRSELQDQLERANKYSTNYRMAKRYKQVEEKPEPIEFYFERIWFE